MYEYSPAFYDYVNAGAVRSARTLLGRLASALRVRSVLDVGCGEGAWLSVWNELGVSDIIGVDGGYVRAERLLIDEDRFVASDLRHSLQLGRRFDLVQCLEVAEHLPPARGGGLVEDLTRHGDVILFSAAPPGQGGHHHINERSYEYWRSEFDANDYVAVDCVRPLVRGDSSLEPWYRYNTILYVRRSQVEHLPSEFLAALVPDDEPLSDVAPAGHRALRRMLSLLPTRVVTLISIIEERVISWRLSRQS